ncbi:MAG: hypothetical protein LCI00_27025 [Chloroflexi bacterium]|nr:hypothetical protein [Chloroflexota bacterium]MCC6893996.1 hypothetical protein [Anaerolineae bacterium]
MQPQPRPPMTYSFQELLSRTFQIYGQNFATIVGLVAFVTIPFSLLSIIASPQPAVLTAAGTVSESAQTASILTSILSLIQTVLITAPLTYITSEAIFGRKLTIGEAFSGVSNRFTTVGCGVLFVGIALGLMLLAIVFLGLVFPPALILSGIVLYMVITASALMFPVLTLENINPTSTISRSWSLGKRRFWVIYGIGILVGVILFIIGLLLGNIVNGVINAAAPNMNINLQYLIVSIASDILGIFIMPISPIAFTILYYDIRSRTENLDEQLTSPDVRPIDLPTPASPLRFDGHDWRNIAILSVMGLLIGMAVIQFVQQMAGGLMPALP